MGTVYPRGNRLWIGFYDAKGERQLRPTSYVVGQDAQARAALELVEDRIRAGAAVGDAAGPMLVDTYYPSWIAERTHRVSSWRNDKSRYENYVRPAIGHMPLNEVRPRHIAELMSRLRETLAPRTVRNIYALVSALFADAVVADLVERSPCVLKGRHVGKVVDKDPEWRATAVFTPAEVVTITADEKVPEDRRVFYSVLFRAGPRFGEAAALRWRDYDETAVPLGRLSVAKSIHSVDKREKSTKTQRPRAVPVHPELAAVLKEWKETGFERWFGRKPTPDDRLVPSRLGSTRSVSHMLKKFHRDLDALGLRRRRQHDARRTFVSVARGAGARPDILKWVTHGPPASVMDAYTELPWATLCEAVACVRYAGAAPAPASEAPETGPGAVGLAEAAGDAATAAATVVPLKSRTPATIAGCGGSYWRGVGDSNPWPPA
jgi:integrase